MGSFSALICSAFAILALAHANPVPAEVTAAVENCFEQDVDYPGEDIKATETTTWITKESAKLCQDLCATTAKCVFFTYSTSNKRCYLKKSKAAKTVPEVGAVSGPKKCPAAPAAAALKVTAAPATTPKVVVPVAKTPAVAETPVVADTVVAETPAAVVKVDCFSVNYDYPGNDLGDRTEQGTAALCQAHCVDTATCEFFTWTTTKRCYLKTAKARPVYELGATSGAKVC